MKKRKQFFILGIAALAALLLNPVQAAAPNSLLKTYSSDKASFQKGTLKGKVMFSETMDEATYRYFFYNHEQLVSTGKGWSRGVEFMIQKKLTNKLYGLAASMNLGRGVLDVNNTNSQRLPGYNYLSLRIDRRFHFKRSALIMFASVWNVFNNKGVDGYTWLEASNSLGEGEGFPRIPIIGLEFEF